jgi:hypothetical protein
LDELEEAGVVGPGNGAKPREILMDGSESATAKIAPAAARPAPEASRPAFHAVTMTRDSEEEEETVEDSDEEYEQVFAEEPENTETEVVELSDTVEVSEDVPEEPKEKDPYDENDQY